MLNFIDSDKYDPLNCENSYTKKRVSKVLENVSNTVLENVLTKVFTYDLKIVHEERFIHDLTTLSNVRKIMLDNPKETFTAQIVANDLITIDKAFDKLYINTLVYIADIFDITVFGGTVYDSIFTKNMMTLKDFKKVNPDKKPICVDLTHIIKKTEKLDSSILVFSHFGYNQFLETNKNDWSLYKRSFSNEKKEFEISSSILIDKINEIDDDTRYTYDIAHLCIYINELINIGYIHIELYVKYELDTQNLLYIELNNICNTKDIGIIYQKNKIIVSS